MPSAKSVAKLSLMASRLPLAPQLGSGVWPARVDQLSVLDVRGMSFVRMIFCTPALRAMVQIVSVRVPIATGSPVPPEPRSLVPYSSTTTLANGRKCVWRCWRAGLTKLAALCPWRVRLNVAIALAPLLSTAARLKKPKPEITGTGFAVSPLPSRMLSPMPMTERWPGVV